MTACTVRSDRGPARLRSHAGAAAGVDCQQTVCGSACNPGPLSERVRTSPKTLVHNRSPQHRRCDSMLAERLPLAMVTAICAYSCCDCIRHEVAILARRRRRESNHHLWRSSATRGIVMTYAEVTQFGNSE